jgi:hypothetical protein
MGGGLYSAGFTYAGSDKLKPMLPYGKAYI